MRRLCEQLSAKEKSMTDDTLQIANGYGNVDVRDRLPGGYVHIKGQRLQPLCRKLRIKYAKALVEIKKYRRDRHSPVFDGVVVSSRSADKLLAEIVARQERSTNRRKPTPEQRVAARSRRQQLDVGKFAAMIRQRFPSIPEDEDTEIAEHACEISSGRVGRSNVADDPVMAAVIAHIRHCHTNYEQLLDRPCELDVDPEERAELRREARHQVADQIRVITEKWQQPQ
jgi:hypothetical protein